MARTVTVTFDDGQQHQYAGVPDDATPDSVQLRAVKDFPDRKIKSLDGGRTPAKEFSAEVPPTTKTVAADVRQESAKHEGMEHRNEGDPVSVGPAMIDAYKAGFVSTLNLPQKAVEFFGGSKGIQHLEKLAHIPTSDEAQAGMEKTFGVKHTPVPLDPYGKPSKGNEYLVKIAEFAGSADVPLVGLVASSEEKIATLIAGELAMLSGATTSVEGKEVGEKIAARLGDDPKRGGEIGEVIGSFAGPGGVGKLGQMVMKGSQKTANILSEKGVIGFSEDAQKAAAHKILNDEIQASIRAFPDHKANIERAMDLSKVIDRYALPLPQASGAPGLIAMYREVTNKSPDALAKAAKTDADNLAAIRAFKDKSIPESKERLFDAARLHIDETKTQLSSKIENNEREIRALSGQYESNVDNQEIGNTLRQKYWEARKDTKQVLSGQINNVYAIADKIGVKEDMASVRDSVEKIVKQDESTFQDMPPLFRKILSQYKDGTPAKIEREQVTPTGAKSPIWRTKTVPATEGSTTTSFQELHSLYKQANQDWFDSIAAGNDAKARYVSIVKDQLKEKLDKFEKPEYGGLGSEFKKFNDDYSRYSRIYKTGVGGDIAKTGRSMTDAEDIVRKVIFQKGKSKGVRDFMEIYGNDKKAFNTLHDGILDVMYRDVMDKGEISPTKLATFMSDKGYGAALSELPDFKKRLSNVENLNRDLINRRLVLNNELKAVDRSVVSKIAQGEDANKTIKAALDNQNVMKGLLSVAKTPESKRAIARAISDHVSKMDDPFGYVIENEKTIKPILDSIDPKHYENLKTIAEAEKALGRVNAPKFVELANPQDIGEKTIGTSVKGLFSILRRMNTPLGVSPEYVVLDVGGRFVYKLRAAELARLREAAMTDPDIAKVMAELAKNPEAGAKERLLNLKGLAASHGITVTSVVTQPIGQEKQEIDR